MTLLRTFGMHIDTAAATTITTIVITTRRPRFDGRSSAVPLMERSREPSPNRRMAPIRTTWTMKLAKLSSADAPSAVGAVDPTRW